MIDKLRSHLRKNEKGFTLIELLVVIAIIAILVVIVVVAINPVERINEGRDRTARANARATGTVLSACMTIRLAQATPGTFTDCDTQGDLDAVQAGDIATGVDVEVDDTTTPADLCATDEGRAGRWYRYRHSTGTTEEVISAYPAAGARC